MDVIDVAGLRLLPPPTMMHATDMTWGGVGAEEGPVASLLKLVSNILLTKTALRKANSRVPP